MDSKPDTSIQEARQCLIRAAGWTTQDFGMGRIVGEVFALVFFSKEPISLDDIEKELALSKAAVSIATRQLDKLSLLERVKNQGDRKIYYRISAHFAASLKNGILEMLRSKLQTAEDVLNQAEAFLKDGEDSEEKEFFKGQISRAKRIRNQTDKIINNPIFKLITR
jgi:DNA-binding transcriptional regulator GbsR (MarR family)